MTVNPYESPTDEQTSREENDDRQTRGIVDAARIGSLAGAFTGATYGAVTGASIGFACVAYTAVLASDDFEYVAQQSFVFGIGMAIINTLLGILNGAVIGGFDGLLTNRLGNRFEPRLLIWNVLSLGSATGYQGYLETTSALDYLSSLMGNTSLHGAMPIALGTTIGVIGGVFTGLALTRTLNKVLIGLTTDGEQI